MANEAVIIESPEAMRRYQVANGVGLSKGQLLTLIDPNSVSGSTTATFNEAFAGICAFEKVANDGSTEVTATTKGIFDLYAGIALTAGDLVSMSGVNMVRKATASDILSGCVVGKALETATTGETIRVAVGVMI